MISQIFKGVLYNDTAVSTTTAIAASDKDPGYDKDDCQDKENILQSSTFNVDYIGECQDPQNKLLRVERWIK